MTYAIIDNFKRLHYLNVYPMETNKSMFNDLKRSHVRLNRNETLVLTQDIASHCVSRETETILAVLEAIQRRK